MKIILNNTTFKINKKQNLLGVNMRMDENTPQLPYSQIDDNWFVFYQQGDVSAIYEDGWWKIKNFEKQSSGNFAIRILWKDEWRGKHIKIVATIKNYTTPPNISIKTGIAFLMISEGNDIYSYTFDDELFETTERFQIGQTTILKDCEFWIKDVKFYLID